MRVTIVGALITASATVVGAVVVSQCQQRSKQTVETHGDSSPGVVAGGDVSIVIEPSMARDVGKAFLDYANSNEHDKAELQRQLRESYERQLPSADPRDSADWADRFVNSLPTRRQVADIRTEEKRSAYENEKSRAAFLVRIAFQVLDDRAHALAGRMHGVSYVKVAPLPELYTEPGGVETLLAALRFPNGCSLELRSRSGAMTLPEEVPRLRPAASLSVREPQPCLGARVESRLISTGVGGGQWLSIRGTTDERLDEMRKNVGTVFEDIVAKVAMREREGGTEGGAVR